MENKTYWQLFTESGDPLDYIKYKSNQARPQRISRKGAAGHENL